MTAPIQNPRIKGDPIGLIDVISTKFLSCRTAFDEDVLFLFE